MEYVNCTLDYQQYAFIGDDWADLELVLFPDADLASDKSHDKIHLARNLFSSGPLRSFPLRPSAKSKGWSASLLSKLSSWPSPRS